MFYCWEKVYEEDIYKLEKEIQEYKKDIKKNRLEKCYIISGGLRYLQNSLIEMHQVLHRIQDSPNSKESLETMGMYMYDIVCKRDREIHILQTKNTKLEYTLCVPPILLQYTPLPKDCIDIIMDYEK